MLVVTLFLSHADIVWYGQLDGWMLIHPYCLDADQMFWVK
jgi:hypothetical protein